MSTVITSQPRTQDFAENENDDTNATPLTDQEDEARNKEKENVTEEVCCCVLESAEDAWFICQCISWCFRSMVNCTEECCDDCAECIISCCEISGETEADGDCF